MEPTPPNKPRTLRIIIAKPGMDGHDRGAKIIARALRDAGMEVIYLGLRQTAQSIVHAAIQEDADAIGLSILSGSHMHHFREVHQLLEAQNALDIVLFGGGIIPEEDLPALLELGVRGVFTPGAHTAEVVAFLQENVREKI